MSPRKPGRPAGGDPARTRARLVAAAREQLAAKGFAGASSRSIARAADVDPSLIAHHFGSREGLLMATLDLPTDPVGRLTAALDGPLDGMGERLVRTFITTWDPHRETFSAVMRSVMGAGGGPTAMGDVARHVVVALLTERLDGDELRAELVVAQMLGLAAVRYVVGAEPLRDAAVETVVAGYAAAVQAVIGA